MNPETEITLTDGQRVTLAQMHLTITSLLMDYIYEVNPPRGDLLLWLIDTVNAFYAGLGEADD